MRMTDALSHLPAASVRHAEDTLLGLLPPPVPDTPEARAGCDAGAMAHAIALRPADAAELMMAVQIVGTHAHAMECHRLSNQPGLAIDLVLRSRSQALAMMRVARDGRRLLLEMQARRAKRLAVDPGQRPKAQPRCSASSRRCLGRSARSCIDRAGTGCRLSKRRDGRAYGRAMFGSGRVAAAIWIGAAR